MTHTPPAIFRGTQRTDPGGILRSSSWTDSLGVAVIWSARPGDAFSYSEEFRRATFLSTSTVHEARIAASRVLHLSDQTYMSLGDLFGALPFSEAEAKKVFNYLHNRIIGKASGGDFEYEYRNEFDEPMDSEDLPFSLLHPVTLMSEAREDWDWQGSEVADRVLVDTYALADTPAVQRAAIAAGFEALSYWDVFAGGEYGARELLGVEVEQLDHVSTLWGLDGRYVPTHWTYRPLVASAIQIVGSVPTASLLP